MQDLNGLSEDLKLAPSANAVSSKPGNPRAILLVGVHCGIDLLSKLLAVRNAHARAGSLIAFDSLRVPKKRSRAFRLITFRTLMILVMLVHDVMRIKTNVFEQVREA
jgi:hypothetical protein